MTAAILTIAIILAGFFLVFYVFFPLGRGAVYVPSTPEKVRQMAELSGVARGEKAADLGSGDGRVVIECARRGAEAHGFEVNPILVLLSRRAIRRAGVQDRAFIHWKSFWRARLSPFDVVTIFQGSFVMRRLEKKLRKELAAGARVVSDYWGFPTLGHKSVHGTLFCYRIGSPRGEP
jgi:precorrin-6B methylase 2